MTVYDCCAFFNENDLYEIRFKEHWNWVDKFIIIEAGETHTGLKKPLNFDHKRFEPFKEKIIYRSFDNFIEEIKRFPYLLDDEAMKNRGPHVEQLDWIRAHFQSNYIWQVLQEIEAKDTDIVYASCPDEILRESAARQALERFDGDFVDSQGHGPIFGFHYYLYAYKINLLHKHWRDHVAGQMQRVGSFRHMAVSSWRSKGYSNQSHITNAGWHFTFLDNTDGEMVLAKQRSWSHARDRYPGRRTKFENTSKQEALQRFWEDYPVVKVDITSETHPETIVKNLDQYQNLVYHYDL